MRIRCLLLGLLLALVAACGAVSQVARAPDLGAELDPLIREELARQEVPGVAVAVVRGGALAFAGGFGLADVEHQVPVKPETIFQSGSVGKMFTAALVMKLADAGHFGLDEPLHRHLPGTPPAWQAITIRQLLTHTSGLADPYGAIDLRKDYSEEELLAIDGTLPLLFEPGSQWSYSNMGYHVLGFLCSRVGGRFYGDQLIESLFRPAGMATASIISERAIVPNRAAGYEKDDRGLKNQEWVAPRLNTTADGSIYLTVLDMAAWDLALDDERLLTEAQRAAMWTPVKLTGGAEVPYGFGWSLEPFGGRRALSHGGAWQGFTSCYLRLPDEQLSVVVLANAAFADPGEFAARIARQLLKAK